MSRKQDPFTVEFLLMGVIAKKPIHAYDLNKVLLSDPELKVIWRFNQSQLYAVLDKIERNKLIQSEISSGSAFPFRKVFTLTDYGRQRFEEWLKTPVVHASEMRSDFMAKLYFLKDRPSEEYQAVLQAQIESCNEWVEHLKGLGAQTDYLRMVYDFRIRSCLAMADWLNQCLNSR